jgi:hypothetical protein
MYADDAIDLLITRCLDEFHERSREVKGKLANIELFTNNLF